MTAHQTLAASPNIRARSEAESAALYSRIKKSIIEGLFPAGTRLPTDRALSSEHRVARNTVRKTMDKLMQEGLIVREVGRGTFVAEIDKSQNSGQDLEFSLPELFEARLLFEPSLVELVVERATEVDFTFFDDALRRMQSASTWVEYKEAKYDLHLAIAKASQNRFILQVFETIVASRRAAGWGRPGRHPGPLALVRETACRDSAAIVDALRARDKGRASDLMRDYLVRTLFSVSAA